MVLDQRGGTLKRHPLNTSFKWANRPVNNLKLLSASQINAYNQNGFVVLNNFADASTVEELLAAIDPLEAGLPDSVLTMADGYTLRYAADKLSFARNLVAQSRRLKAFATSLKFKALMNDLIGPDIQLYWDQAVYKKPGQADEFPYHQDNGYTFVRPQAYITCWLALCDVTMENGCPSVLPGLHHAGTLEHENAPEGLRIKGISNHSQEATEAPLCAGDMLVFSSLTPHRTGPNLTDSVRKGYILQYVPVGACVMSGDGSNTSIAHSDIQPILEHRSIIGWD